LLKHPTLEQLHALGLYGMAKALVEIDAAGQAEALGHHEWLGLLLDRETSWRRDKRLATRLRIAKLRHQAAIEDVDYRSPRGLDRTLFQKLAEGEWINHAEGLLMTGLTGVGKSWLACAIGHKACRDNRSFSIIVGQSSAKTSRWPGAMAVTRAFCARSGAPIS
jgi:DNA replication protein DnaC